MKFFILAALSAPALVAGQYGPPPGPATSAAATSSSAAPTPSAAPGQHLVMVGPNNGFTFEPNNITAAVNETVTFLFPTSGGFIHSVTQTSFANPCTLLQGGFDSGLQPNNMQFTITITNASQPIWFYCKQTTPLKHCGMGMVGGINIPPTSNNSVAAFTAAAIALGNNEGDQSASGGLTGVGAAATAPASSTSIGAAPGATQPSGAERLIIGTGSLLAGLFAAIYTLA